MPRFLVPLWSGVNVAGVQFRDILPNIGLETDEERWNEIAKEVVRLWVRSSSNRRVIKEVSLINFQRSHSEMFERILEHSDRSFDGQYCGCYIEQYAEDHASFNHDSSTKHRCYFYRNFISRWLYQLSLCLQGHHEVCHEMYLSLPCSLGEQGVTNIVRMRITEHEKKLFQTSANLVYNVQKDIKIWKIVKSSALRL